MPQCPFCKAAVWVGQRYCATCLNDLPQPEGEDHFCPQCGSRVASPEEICRQCEATLAESAETPSPAPAKAWRLPPRVLGISLGIGLVFVALLLVFLFNKSPGPLQLMATLPPQAASKQTPAAAPSPTAETAPSSLAAPAVQETAVPSAPETPSPPEVTTPTPSPPRYFVNIPGLALRNGPTISATQISTLYFKEEVELLDTSGGWGRVRDVRRNIVGWSALRYLQPVAADGPRALPGPEEPEPVSSEASPDM